MGSFIDDWRANWLIDWLNDQVVNILLNSLMFHESSNIYNASILQQQTFLKVLLVQLYFRLVMFFLQNLLTLETKIGRSKGLSVTTSIRLWLTLRANLHPSFRSACNKTRFALNWFLFKRIKICSDLRSGQRIQIRKHIFTMIGSNTIDLDILLHVYTLYSSYYRKYIVVISIKIYSIIYLF